MDFLPGTSQGCKLLRLLIEENDKLRKELCRRLSKDSVDTLESEGIILRDKPNVVDPAATALVARARHGQAAVSAQQPVIPPGDAAVLPSPERGGQGHMPNGYLA